MCVDYKSSESAETDKGVSTGAGAGEKRGADIAEQTTDRQRRLEELKRCIEAGTYHNPSSELAVCLMRHMLVRARGSSRGL